MPALMEFTDVVQDVHAPHSVHPGESVHLDLRHRRAVREIKKGPDASRRAIPMNPRRGVKARGRQAHACHVRGFHNFSERNFFVGTVAMENETVGENHLRRSRRKVALINFCFLFSAFRFPLLI